MDTGQAEEEISILPSTKHPPPSTPVIFLWSAPSKSLAESITKGIQPKGSNGAEHHGHRLAELDGAGKGSAAEDDGGEEAKLDAVGLVVLDAVAAEAVCFCEGRPLATISD